MKRTGFWVNVFGGFITTIAAFAAVACGDDNGAHFEAADFTYEGCLLGEDSTGGYLQLLDTHSYIEAVAPATGAYDIEICYLDDTVHQTTYALRLGDQQIVSWLNKNRDGGWSLLSGQNWHSPKNISMHKGDVLRFVASFENGSSGAIKSMTLTPSKFQSVASKSCSQSDVEQVMPQFNESDYVTQYPLEYPKAFKNPLKGFRPNNVDREYVTLIKTYLKWNVLEQSASDGVDKIIEASNKRWEGFAENNVKAIPRVYLEWPGQSSGWADDMVEGDYTSDTFKVRVLAMIEKLAQAWDNDPRVAYVEMGLIGEWGEMEFPATTAQIRTAIGQAFADSFKNKLVMIRWPNTYDDHIHNFGYYWDSFAHYDQEYYTYSLRQKGDRWKSAVIGGEAAYNWGNDEIQPGVSPDASLKIEEHRDYVIDRIRSLHTNHLGWISNYTESDEAVAAGADLMQQAFGYRFVITEFAYPKRVESGSEFSFAFSLRNIGSTPLYYNWPVEISLLDPSTREVVYSNKCQGVDLRGWLPGDKWNDETNEYEIAAKDYVVKQTMTLSPNIKAGRYILAIAILDPAGDLPAVRFAIENYYNGGRHPIGSIGVGCDIDDYMLDQFDDIQSDRSLYYKY